MLHEQKGLLVEVCKQIAAKNLVCGSGGNVSVRAGDTVLITPSGEALGSLKISDIVELSIEGDVKSGGVPSKEMPFHLAIYREKPDVHAIVHTHSFYSVCVSVTEQGTSPEEVIPPYTPSYVMKVGKVPLVPFQIPGSQELSHSIIDTFRKYGCSGVLLQNHGVVSVAGNLSQALAITEEIEENARIHIVLNGKGRRLSSEEIAGIAARYR